MTTRFRRTISTINSGGCFKSLCVSEFLLRTVNGFCFGHSISFHQHFLSSSIFCFCNLVDTAAPLAEAIVATCLSVQILSFMSVVIRSVS